MRGEIQMIKRKLTVLIAAILCLAALAGCSGQTSYTAEEIAQELLTNGVYAEELSPVSAKIAQKRYGLTEDMVEETAAYAGTNAVVDEIAVFKAKDDIDAVMEKAAEHIDAQTKTYESYRVDELPKLRDSIVTPIGSYVVVCVSADAAKAQEVVDKLMK